MKQKYILFILFFTTIYFVKAQYTWQGIAAISNTNNQRFDDVYFLNENLGWAANGYYATIYKTVDGGLHWTKQLNETDLGIDLYFRNVQFLNENIGFVGTLNSKIYKTQNGGANWSEVTNITPNPKAICGFDTIGANTVYGCGAYFEPAYIIKSTDSGQNWQYIDMSAYATALVEIKFVDENLGYAAGKNNTGAIVLKTTDGGVTWTEIYNSGTAGEYIWKLQIFKENTDIIYGALQAVSPALGKLIKTTDAGVNWTSKNAPATTIQALGFISTTHGWMGGHTSGIFETTDGGDSWTNLGVGGNLNRLFVINPTTVFASGTTIYKYTNQTLSTKNIFKEQRTPLEIKLLENPVSTDISFTIQFNSADNLLIELYDIRGKFIKKLSKQRIIKQTSKKYKFSVKELTSGMYILNFHNNTGRQSMKFLKI